MQEHLQDHISLLLGHQALGVLDVGNPAKARGKIHVLYALSLLNGGNGSGD